MPLKAFLAERVTAWKPWLWGFQAFLGDSYPEVEADCSQGAASPRTGCTGSPGTNWRSPDGRPHSHPTVSGPGMIFGTWRPLLPATSKTSACSRLYSAHQTPTAPSTDQLPSIAAQSPLHPGHNILY